MNIKKFTIKRSDVPVIDTVAGSVKSLLTGKEFKYTNRESKLRAFEAAQDEGGKIIDANNQRAGKTLSLREHMKMMEGNLTSTDTRSVRERVMQDATVRGNSVLSEEELGGNVIRKGADLGNDKIWNTKTRRELAAKLEQKAQQKDEEHQSELAREKPESNPTYRRGLDHAQASLRLAQGDAASTEDTIREHHERLTRLQDGSLSAEGYWKEIN